MLDREECQLERACKVVAHGAVLVEPQRHPAHSLVVLPRADVLRASSAVPGNRFRDGCAVVREVKLRAQPVYGQDSVDVHFVERPDRLKVSTLQHAPVRETLQA